MKFIKYSAVAIIFIIACPLSWFAAWSTGSWFAVGLSLIMPTFGVFHWILFQILGATFLEKLLSWILGLVGAFITLTLINILLKESQSDRSI